MRKPHEIHADFDAETIVVYQAYPDRIAEPALAAQRFVPPFSFGRMTWIKPSFLWLMHRSRWGTKAGQERVLAVRIRLSSWMEALSLAVLTSFEPKAHRSADAWKQEFDAADVHLQWDTERSLRGAALPCFSIQVGIGRGLIRRFAEEWIVSIEDFSPKVRKLHQLVQSGRASEAASRLPKERHFPVEPALRKRLLLDA